MKFEDAVVLVKNHTLGPRNGTGAKPATSFEQNARLAYVSIREEDTGHVRKQKGTSHPAK
jgi:hypothetical protein